MAGAVPDSYRHKSKGAVARDPLVVRGVPLKFYHIAAEATPVPDAVDGAARAFLTTAIEQGDVIRGDDCGFVILHRCGGDFYFLLLQLWRGANELWEAVFAKESDGGFAAFGSAYPVAGTVRPTFCVWELGVVAHEANAWSRYLASPRHAADLEDWQNDLFEGSV